MKKSCTNRRSGTLCTATGIVTDSKISSISSLSELNSSVPNSIPKSFEERFVELFDNGQITVNCDDAKVLLKEARCTLTYDVDNVPDSQMVRVIIGDNEEGGNQFLEHGDIGFFTWKADEEREDGFFLSYDEDAQQWCYMEYEDLEECEFELIVDETIEIDC